MIVDSGKRIFVPFRRGFTIVELLVVISIIALLISLLLPALSRAEALAKYTVCAANLRSIGQGSLEYAMTYEDHGPAAYEYYLDNMSLDPPVYVYHHRYWWYELDVLGYSTSGADVCPADQNPFNSGAFGPTAPSVLGACSYGINHYVSFIDGIYGLPTGTDSYQPNLRWIRLGSLRNPSQVIYAADGQYGALLDPYTPNTPNPVAPGWNNWDWSRHILTGKNQLNVLYADWHVAQAVQYPKQPVPITADIVGVSDNLIVGTRMFAYQQP
jgi:prepilin-type N-terminal cleavage/methylation domain-containing protein/prepilin-type processing-associated H-X9-DG protein